MQGTVTSLVAVTVSMCRGSVSKLALFLIQRVLVLFSLERTRLWEDHIVAF